MRLHIFNPEHDIALASRRTKFTPPHAARMLRHDLAFIPALWADDGDMVMVEDIDAAIEAVRHIKRRKADVLFVTPSDLRNMSTDLAAQLSVDPWGWDESLRQQLFATNSTFAHTMPDSDSMSKIKRMSNRRFAAQHLLPTLRALDSAFVGEATYLTDIDRIAQAVAERHDCVLKSPWSCSGRGVRYVQGQLSCQETGWCNNILREQGGLMVEPRYNKVADFGLEFEALDDGRIEYKGLSVFQTRNGAYSGNVLATEKDKVAMMAKYVAPSTLRAIQGCVADEMGHFLRGCYAGPFGIDMMVVAAEGAAGFLIHPCVEMNLRRTMGHVALALSPDEGGPQGLMRIDFDDKYRLRIADTGENLLNTGLYS